jgi:DNA replication protein DnaC
MSARHAALTVTAMNPALSPDKRLSSFDFAAVPSVSKAQVMALTEGTEWIDRGANVSAVWATGRGQESFGQRSGACLD